MKPGEQVRNKDARHEQNLRQRGRCQEMSASGKNAERPVLSIPVLLGGAMGYAVSALVLWLFYRSVFGLVLAPAGIFPGILAAKKVMQEREKQKTKRVFLDFLGCFASSIEAGETPEHAVFSCYRSLSSMYRKDWLVMSEMTEMLRRVRMNEPVEAAFSAFAKNIGDEDISRFAEVFTLTKRKGGDLLYVTRSAERTISQKTEVKREINTIISAKRLESMVMTVMPPGMILYFTITDKAFLTPLYSGGGRLLMTVLLLVYGACVFAIVKITDIEV